MKIETLKAREREHILKVLNKTSWDIEKTAHLLQISPSLLRRKIKEHGIQRPQTVPGERDGL
ncbi:MAG: hypothetical protein COS92_03785 [Desulfobacterales bacterium CG07_land_8_20_14_0_80_52_14]|nr:MAG: hypothetical protein COS92_03785 [Desulfobacterales bacterium CG07_land_8_20_14_0_80_52_14]